ncbi:Hypothetical protein CAP_5394 [Chondromyces apiculatus DSM 436]|uniref:Response regulatory domain-containing protein n=1 Tax=Chondromyces apiculatus DSM 436 TaxID=1192034 RepID=A0A017T310_9BACT|nr:Hypothetical protein CAP_5394 [Chondromyces apiculatus DSM 436]
MGEAQLLLDAVAVGATLSEPELLTLRTTLDELPALAWGQAALGERPSRPLLSPRSTSPTLVPRSDTQPRPLVATLQASPPPAPPISFAEILPTRPAFTRATDALAADADSAALDGLDALTALVVGPAPLADALTDAEAPDLAAFEVERIDDPTIALDLARAVAPDLILIDADVPGARALVEALTSDPLTDATPLLLVGHFPRPDDAAPYLALGVARVLPRPASPDTLRRAAIEVAATYVRGEVTRAPLGEISLDQLGARLAEELRRGLCDAAEARGRGARVDLGEGAEVLAALWGAVARIRDLVTIRSQGTVRFSPRGPEGALPLAPWLGPDLSAPTARARAGRPQPGAPGITPETLRHPESALEGLAVVVADDDPAVTWFLAGVLRAAGARVLEAHDGARALDLAYQASPDLVVSDVLMPHLDGFALCRALKRDVVLRDVPVILLSWKEDLLQRLRELGADADGYLRKEASAAAIVQRVSEVLRPRQRVTQRIAAGGETRGRLDGMTTRTLLSLACARRPDARVMVRDAAFLYEVQLRDGRPISATRTAPDGTYQRGTTVLAALLGVGSGRFAVCPPADGDATSSVRPGFEGTLADQLLPPIALARAAQRLLSGPHLTQIERVDIDEQRMSSYVDATPEPARSLLRRLMAGASPRALITTAAAPARLIEDVLCDAAAHGGVTCVLDSSGADLLEPARAREADVLRGLRRNPPSAEFPPPPSPMECALADHEAGTPFPSSVTELLSEDLRDVSDISDAISVAALGQSEREPPQRLTRPWEAFASVPPPAPPSTTVITDERDEDLEETAHRSTLVGPAPAPTGQTPVSPLAAPLPAVAASAPGNPARVSPVPSAAPVPPAAPSTSAANASVAAASAAAATTVAARPARPDPGTPANASAARLLALAAPAVAAPPPAPPAPSAPTQAPLLTLGSLTPPPVQESAPSPPPPRARAVPPAPPIDESPSPTPRRVRRPSSFAPSAMGPAPAEPPRESRATMWVLLAVAAFVFAVGARLARERDLQVAAAPAPEPLPAEAEAAPPPEPSATPAASNATPGESADNPLLPEDLPLPADQKVPDGQALIEIVAGPNDEVLVDGKLLGKGTVRASLEIKSTPHEIRARLRGEERVRFVQIKAGRLTRLRLSPPWRR